MQNGGLRSGPLSDVKVLELGHAISAPYCAKLLADQGSEVIKVEPPGEGDPSRKSGPFPGDIPHREKSGLFLHLNLNKKGITLDFRCSTGVHILRELVAQSDILVENMPYGLLPSLNLGFEDLLKFNPKIVLAAVTPFGRTGPYRSYKSQEIGVFAMSGRMYPHGEPDREPLRYGPDISWYQAGATAAVAVLGALLAARATGVGREVDVSAVETLAGNVDSRLLYYSYSGVKTARGRWVGGYPQGAFPCKDGYIGFGVGYTVHFQRLCHAMGRDDLAQDPKYATAASRANNQEAFEELLLGWTMERSKSEIFQVCQQARVLCAPLLAPGELLEDPQLVAREYFDRVDHPEAGTLPYSGPAFHMGSYPKVAPTPAPLLGQHNHEIYAGRLGFTSHDLATLRHAEVI